VYNAAAKLTDNFKNRIVILIGDKMQLAPVVENGEKIQILNASFYSSTAIDYYIKFHFTHNLRLINSNDPAQNNYNDLALQIGQGTYNHPNIINHGSNEEIEDGYRISFQSIPYHTNIQHAIQWLHPDGFDSNSISTRAVLASTNEQVDQWNETIQSLNENELYELPSEDEFHEVDDPNNHIRRMITPDVLHRFEENGAPPHNLKLKIGDIAILLRHYDKELGLSNNRRVQIMNITKYRITIKTLNEIRPIYASLPRFRFELQLPYKKSYKMKRTQFPLRLAYAQTVHRAQGQEYNKILIDVRQDFFAHGQLYVALSRAKIANNVNFFCTKDNLTDNHPTTNGIVYKEITESFE
jgi:ATP-dependent exoDNAse (exonuclease V) alpha subunit